MSTRDERAEETRRELLRAGRELFAELGYAAVGTEDIVARAGLTRGALYHHFTGKKGLFEAVHEEYEAEFVGIAAAAIQGVTDPGMLLEVGISAFFDACTDPRRIRVTLVDAPNVLGWQAWREIGERYGLGLVIAALTAAVDAGEIACPDIRTMAHVVLGALGEAAMIIGNADDPAAARGLVEPTVLALVRGLRPR
jgi:AcrR family transcriptional regulator